MKTNSHIKNLKVIFFTPYPEESAATRYRILQWFPYLSRMGIACQYSSMMSKTLYRIKNRKHLWNIPKTLLLITGLIKRLLELITITRYDAVFLHREYFPFLTPFFERIVSRLNKNVIFDFDDAIYCRPTYNRNWRDLLRNPERVSRICQMSSCTVVGNEYLRNYASMYSKCTVVIPTVFDIGGIKNRCQRPKNNKIVIGWIGSWHTVYSLLSVTSVLKRLSSSHDFVLKIVGQENIYDININGVAIDYQIGRWDTRSIVEYIMSFDIGIMPLIDSEWERGKCGFKLLQYLTCGIPAVASPVGVNRDIINDGINGFLAANEDEWVSRLALLIERKDLRDQLGEEGRKDAEARYSPGEIAVQLSTVIKKVCDGTDLGFKFRKS